MSKDILLRPEIEPRLPARTIRPRPVQYWYGSNSFNIKLTLHGVVHFRGAILLSLTDRRVHFCTWVCNDLQQHLQPTITQPIFFLTDFCLEKFFLTVFCEKKYFFLTVNCKKCFSKVFSCFLPLFLIWFWSITLKWLIFNIYFWKIAGLRPSASGPLFSVELLETLRLFNSTIYLELEEMYGTVQKSNLLSKLF